MPQDLDPMSNSLATAAPICTAESVIGRTRSAQRRPVGRHFFIVSKGRIFLIPSDFIIELKKTGQEQSFTKFEELCIRVSLTSFYNFVIACILFVVF